MTLVRIMVAAGLLAAISYTVVAVLVAARFPLANRDRRRTPPVAFEEWPVVSILKPIRGLDPLRYQKGDADKGTHLLRRDLIANLSSFFRQDYRGRFEILFGLQDPDDPALAVVEEVRRLHPHVRTNVLFVPQARGPNVKASVLAALAADAEGDVLVVSDQDMRVDANYLEAVVAPFASKEVGLVTCPYRTRYAWDIGGIFEALTINVDFIPAALVACSLERWLSFALGATMAIRRKVLRAIGGFEGLQPFLADDYLLGNRTFHAGWRVEMCPYVVDNILPPTGFRQYFVHQVRWNRGYRVCRPLGYFFSVLMNGTAFALASILVLGWTFGTARLLAAWLLLRFLAASFLFRRVAGRRAPLAWLLLVPCKDLVSLVIWVVSMTGHRVEWGGQTFVLESDGRLLPVDDGSK